jgi:hypothetical protein
MGFESFRFVKHVFLLRVDHQVVISSGMFEETIANTILLDTTEICVGKIRDAPVEALRVRENLLVGLVLCEELMVVFLTLLEHHALTKLRDLILPAVFVARERVRVDGHWVLVVLHELLVRHVGGNPTELLRSTSSH